MVAKTYDESKKFDLSQKFDELLSRLTPYEYDTISDATLLQLISLLLAKDCKKQTILKLSKSKFIATWPAAVSSIEEAVEYFRNCYRIPVSQLLPYNTLLVPFAYFFFHHKNKPDAKQKKLLEDFFWRCALGARYSSSVETKLSQDVRRVEHIIEGKSPDYDWAVDTSPEFLIDNGWFNTSRSSVKAILCLYAYHLPKSFSDNSLVNIRNYWLKRGNSKNYHHFFPRAFLAKKGFDEWEINNVLNITIVDDYLNKREIRAQAPSRYMRKFSDENEFIGETMKSHLIQDLDDFGITRDDYRAFLTKRAEIVSSELRKRLIARAVDSEGQKQRQDDYEEEPAGFE